MNIFQKRLLSPDEIIDLFNKKKLDSDWSFEGCTPSQTGKWTHDFHRYPAKFIPQLVEKLLDEYIESEDVHINDPFLGSGTTIVTAISRGMRASGTDINKLALLIAQAKSTPIPPDYLAEKIEAIISRLFFLERESAPHFADKIAPLIPSQLMDRMDYWFSPENKLELGIIFRVINEEVDRDIHNFLLVAFSHILKNCSRWLQTSTKPTRDFNKIPASPIAAFKRQLNKMQNGHEAFYKIVPARVRDNIQDFLNIKIGDARRQPVTEESVDLIVSSSPYVTSYEYADLHQLSTIWLEFADDLYQYKK